MKSALMWTRLLDAGPLRRGLMLVIEGDPGKPDWPSRVAAAHRRFPGSGCLHVLAVMKNDVRFISPNPQAERN
jgi:hypothetical protein